MGILAGRISNGAAFVTRAKWQSKAWFLLLVALASACSGAPSAPPTGTSTESPGPNPLPTHTREESLGPDAVRMGPATDPHPPILHSSEWLPPLPLPGPINTAGAEDSPFITPDGETFLFFFTPNAQIPPEQQLMDGVTGLYISRREGESWGEPQRLVLQDPGELALDGCGFLQGELLWFCSARQGNLRDIDLWFADLRDGSASNWRNAGAAINLELNTGEMHLSADGQSLFFHAPRPGADDFDLYVARRLGDGWSPAEPLAALNSEASEGWPFVSEDGAELWFTRFYLGAPAIFRSSWTGSEWSAPELILSSFAGEPTLDRLGNLYFVHHYVVDDVIIEADIYYSNPS